MKYILILLISIPLYAQSLSKGLVLSVASGVSLGFRESYDFNYTHDEFLPESFQKWYEYRVNSDKVMSKFFTWGKVWREADIITSVSALIQLNKYFDNWIYSYLVYWVVKNTTATIVRDRFKTGDPFYSFKVALIL